MSKTDDLKQQEIEELNKTEIEEFDLNDFESLIIEGTEARIPISFELPLYDKEAGKMIVRRMKCYLKPLTSTDVQNAQRKAHKSTTTTLQLELLKKGMYGGDDEPFTQKLINSLPTGVVDSISEKLMDVSGVKIDAKQQKQMTEDIMGF